MEFVCFYHKVYIDVVITDRVMLGSCSVLSYSVVTTDIM